MFKRVLDVNQLGRSTSARNVAMRDASVTPE